MSMSSCSQHFPSVMSEGYSQADSDEIDVFEATWYFSGGIDGAGLGLQRAMREERVISRGGDRSLDALARSARPPQQSKKVENQSKDKKSRQPSSAGRRLASFLNSFIKQATSKKKSRALNPTESKEAASFEKMHAGRRKGSINCSQRMKSNDYSILCARESCCNSKSSGHRKYAPFCSQREAWCDKRVIDEDWLVERCNSMDGYPENKWLTSEAGNRLLDKEALWSEEFMKKQEKWFRRTEEEEDGRGSESSSELFELKNYDLGKNVAFR
ncbi:hypothetical protein BHM03_00053678 [Ensete ventricosum]|nr:hypothetical protein BHM03_00053678 [Ensete ventricosum]